MPSSRHSSASTMVKLEMDSPNSTRPCVLQSSKRHHRNRDGKSLFSDDDDSMKNLQQKQSTSNNPLIQGYQLLTEPNRGK
ncbi:hypothetical protein QR98_0104620 [Sarcoptes scabiei]|uniref:Uncharacterized protein n=1 Tax=Sarcoptes scabiei TaxID=52283 RepID=A0A132ALP4_SARSC|nr:hypothetical protein QR98_0104620 [Sarcoptes scabiei]